MRKLYMKPPDEYSRYHFLHDTCALLSTLSFVTQLEMKAKNYHTRKYPTLSHIIVLTELISML